MPLGEWESVRDCPGLVYKKGRLDVGVLRELVATEEWARAGPGNMREEGEESDIETEGGGRKEGLPETPRVWWTVLIAR